MAASEAAAGHVPDRSLDDILADCAASSLRLKQRAVDLADEVRAAEDAQRIIDLAQTRARVYWEDSQP